MPPAVSITKGQAAQRRHHVQHGLLYRAIPVVRAIPTAGFQRRTLVVDAANPASGRSGNPERAHVVGSGGAPTRGSTIGSLRSSPGAPASPVAASPPAEASPRVAAVRASLGGAVSFVRMRPRAVPACRQGARNGKAAISRHGMLIRVAGGAAVFTLPLHRDARQGRDSRNHRERALPLGRDARDAAASVRTAGEAIGLVIVGGCRMSRAQEPAGAGHPGTNQAPRICLGGSHAWPEAGVCIRSGGGRRTPGPAHTLDIPHNEADRARHPRARRRRRPRRRQRRLHRRRRPGLVPDHGHVRGRQRHLDRRLLPQRRRPLAAGALLTAPSQVLHQAVLRQRRQLQVGRRVRVGQHGRRRMAAGGPISAICPRFATVV